MKNTVLFIAMSLDGYIAGKDGSLDWLHGQKPGEDDMVSYYEFSKSIDTVIMGWNTYRQLTEELSPGHWMYPNLKSYVLTHREAPARENKSICFVNEDVCGLVNALRREDGKAIWICGGAGVIQPLLREGAIDRLHISVIPTILGGGIRLFEENDKRLDLELVGTKSYNGITDLIYVPRP